MRLARRHQLLLAGTSAVAVAATLLTVAATRSPGYTASRLSPNDGGIWITSDHDGLYGRLNVPVGALDAAFFPPGGNQQNYQLDIVQSGNDVVARDRANGKLYPVDVAQAAPISDHGIALSATAQVRVGGGTVAILDPAAGKVWATRSESDGIATMAGLDSNSKPLATLGSASGGGVEATSALAVGTDGTVHAVSSDGKEATLRPDASGTGFEQAEIGNLNVALQSVQVTAVGGRRVALDARLGTVLLPSGKTVTLPGGGGDAVLQQPSATGSRLYLATASALYAITLADGAISTLGTLGTGPAAAPMILDGCAYAAWTGTPGGAARSCGGKPAQRITLAAAIPLVKPELRVNSRAVALNDLTSGAVWDLRTGKRVDNWKDVTPATSPTSKKNKRLHDATQGRTLQKPRAVPDDLGARPGHTAVLHVLDNDSDPSGNILSIKSVTAASDSGAGLASSPDGQTIQITMPTRSGDVRFSYTVDDGKGLSASAAVTVHPRSAGDNRPPTLRPGFSAHAWSVAFGGNISLPVLGDWRDYDGDPALLVSASASAGSVTTTPDGRLNFTAPLAAGRQQLRYTVSDGAAATEAVLKVEVLAATSSATVPATTEPDVGRGQAGQPIVLNPLDNDLPGADPSTPTARLQLALDVAGPDGTTVVSNRKAGSVTLSAAHAGTYLFTYTVSYGNAPYAKGSARVDVVTPPGRNVPPVAMLDNATLHGQGAAIVDVLANDYDAAGNLLVVQSASAADSASVQVAIISGRWLRINALTPQLSPNPQIVRYVITDGVTGSVTGEVSVSQLRAPADNTPVPQDDYATVRAGDSVTVPVLDNDTDPGGDPLSLNADASGAPKPGELTVASSEGGSDDLGRAYVSGNVLRYAAPAAVASEQTFTISYPAQNSEGDQAIGHAYVSVEPAPTVSKPDQAPAPPVLQARAVAGDTISVAVATNGVDPDGDSVTLVGIAGPASRGRILSSNASTLTYQAYPTSSGTDDFSYTVADRYGRTGTGAVRLAVVPPGDPQPPVAADDVVTAAPGSRISVDVLANDYRTADDQVIVRPLAGDNRTVAGGAVLESPAGPLDITAGTGHEPVVLRYSITDGLGQPSAATLTVRARSGANIAPVVVDAYATPGAHDNVVTVDVLGKDSDPDGDARKLRVSQIFDPRATSSAGTVTLPVLDHPQVVAFEVTDAGGGVALASIFVPATGSGAPYLKANQIINLAKNGSKTVDIRDYLVDPAGKAISLTTSNQLWTSPSGQLAGADASGHEIRLTAAKDYAGPAALTFGVTDGAGLTDPEGTFAVITIPVQVGPETPVLRCPNSAITLIEGGPDVDLDITSLCHVWVADPRTLTNIQYQGSFQTQAPGITVGNPAPRIVRLTATSSAVPGTTAVLSVAVAGTGAVPAQLRVRVALAPRPTMSPVTVDGVIAGKSATVNVADYVNSQLRDPVLSVVRVVQSSGMTATRTANGTAITLTPGMQAHGTMTFAVTVSDVPSSTRVDHYATGTITLHVLGVPDVPGTPVPERSAQSHVATVSWAAPANNGEPIDYYQLDYEGGSRTCPASPCSVTKLVNGSTYHFSVKAHNAVGWSRSSGPSGAAQPNAVPGAVRSLRTADPQDRSLALSWNAAEVDGTPIFGYTVSWPGGRTSTSTTAVRVPGLNNNARTTFTVVAVNAQGPGRAVTVTGQSSGTPAPPAGVTLAPSLSADLISRTERISWRAVSPNGPGSVSYTVRRTGGSGAKTVCTSASSTSCTDDGIANDGTSYAYTVIAANATASAGPGHVSLPSAPASMVAAATPGPVTNLSAEPTGVDRQLEVRFDAPSAHAHQLTVSCSVNGASCNPSQWQFGANGQRRVVKTITLGANGGSPLHITLKACNDSQLAQSCSDPVSTDSDPAYGQIQGVTITDLRADGPYLTYTVNVKPNGKPARVAVSVSDVIGSGELDSRSELTDATADEWSKTYTSEVGFGKAVVVRATASDPVRPPNRFLAQQTARTKDGGVELSRGASNTTTPGCSTAACAVLHLRVQDLGSSRTASCRFTVNGEPSNALPEFPFSTDAKGGYEADLPAPTYVFGTVGARLAATCGDTTAYVSDTFVWPPA